MFKNLFKNAKSVGAAVMVDTLTLSNGKNYPTEVLEIHHEFEVAADKLLENAYAIINSQPTVNKSKIERLSKFGFKQVKEIEEGNEILKKTELSEETINLVKYYKVNYPYNKFITEEQVKTICHKYNLVCGEVARFRGFVPEANLEQIENFKLKKAESNLLRVEAIKYSSNIIFEFDIQDYTIERHTGKYYHFYKKDVSGYAFQSEDGIDFYSGDKQNIFGLSHLGNIRFNIQGKSGFQICAPVKDMDISGLELIEGYKLQRKHIPDPVVLQPVKGGYLVVTAWGDEASDELVVNESMN
ncbi:MAG TPA: hypothetical protein VF680_17040 [Allosphingosinicella sp.]|jgi:hypothetical protein